MSLIYTQAEQFILKKFTEAGVAHSIPHLVRTVFWLLKLKFDASEVLKVAALMHDADRFLPVRRSVYHNIFKESIDGFRDAKYLELHQNNCALVTEDFLRSIDVDQDFLNQVRDLIRCHEVGGSEEQNLLRDADSISFFENNAIHFIEKYPTEFSMKKVRDKIDWMYNRMEEQRKIIAKPFFDKATARIDEYYQSQI